MRSGGTLTLYAPVIWTNADLFSIGSWQTYFNEILVEIQTFSSKEIHLEIYLQNDGHFASALTHWGLMTQYGDIDLGQHWLR